MENKSKPLRWLHGEVKTPPISISARRELGYLLRLLQDGLLLSMPQSRPMPSIGAGCHELRVTDSNAEWRLIYHLDADAIVILDVFRKTTRATPKQVLDACKARLAKYKEDFR
jgi:phage-related protein